ncbi:MAG: hypothetical protein AB7K52_07155 [Phycisphaerales bacterium]
MPNCSSSLLARCIVMSAAIAGLSTVGSGQILSQTVGTIFTSYNASATPVQGAAPGVGFRGVGVSGAARGWSGAFAPAAGVGHSWDSNRYLGSVRLDSLSYDAHTIDLALPADVPWVIGRTFNQIATSNGPQGYNWFQTSQPEIVLYDTTGTSDDMLYLVYGNDRYAEFLYNSASGGNTYYKGTNGANGVFKNIPAAGSDPALWVYYNSLGTTITFFGAGGSDTRAAWQIWKIEDAAGNVAYAGHASTISTAISSGYNADGTLALAYDSAGRRFSYTYSTIDSTQRLTQVKAEIDSGGWVEVGKVDYAYCSTTETVSGLKVGQSGDLKTVTRTIPLTDSGVSLVAKQYYRYYVDSWSDENGKRGAAHQLRMVLDADGYRRYDYSVGSDLNDDTLSASDDTLKPYSSAYFEYGSGDAKIVKAFFNGQCGCGGGSSNGTYERIAYLDWDDAIDYDHNQTRRVVIKRPDGIYISQYFDSNGQPLSRVLTMTDPASSVSTRWTDEVTRTAAGTVAEHLTPEVNSAYDHSARTFSHAGTGDAVYPKHVSGGTLNGFVQATRKFTTQTGDPDSDASYTSASIWLSSTPKFEAVASGVGVERPTIEKRRAYHTAGTNIASNNDETSISTTFWSNTATNILSIVPKQVTMTFPIVSTGNNGSNSATSQERYIRKNGTTAFTVSPTSITTYTQYTNGLLVKRIDDCQTNHGSDFAGGDDPNGDFGITESASGLRVITTYTYDNQGRLDTTTHADGLVTKMYYSKLKDGRMVTIACPRVVAGSPTYYGPMSYTVTNLAGMTEFSGTVAISNSGITTVLTSWIDETDGDPITALDIGTLSSMSTNICSSDGHRVDESRLYHTIPGSGAGSAGTNYDRTLYGYDPMGRQWRVKSPADTITRTVYDSLGRFSARWIGTNDNSFTGGEGSPTDNMVKVEEVEYDGGSSNKNSRVTKRTAFVEGSTTDRRDTTYAYDARGRLIVQINPQAPHALHLYDNLDRLTATAMYSSDSGLDATDNPTSLGTNRVSLSRTYYDEKGQVYEQRTYEINQSNGDIVTSTGDVYLPTLTTYDAQGRVIRTRGTSLSKQFYDRLGRVTDQFTLAKDNDSTYGDAATVSGDTVLEETHTYYQDSTGLPLFTHSIARNFDDTSTTGALDSGADADTATVTAANIKGRVSITAFYYDAWRRQTDVTAYGTNGIVGDGSTSTGTFTHPGSVATRSDAELVTSTTYDTDGTVLETTDPKALVTRFLYDDAGRKIADIRNYVNGTPSGETGDDDVYTRYVYSSGRMTQMWVDFDGDNVQDAGPPADQVTTYTYGVTKGASAGDSKISSNDLLWKATYPDTSGGTDLVTFAYNAQGQEIWKKDQAGNILETVYDTGGRKTDTKATTINTGAGFDDLVKRISLTYLSRGLVDKVKQHDATSSGNVLNALQYQYDNWGNISKILQDRDGDVSAGNNEAQVTFAYSAVRTSDGTGRASVRRTSMTLPKTLGTSDGSAVAYRFGTGGNIAETFGRVSKVSVGGTDVASYQYQGAGMLVSTALHTATADTSYRMHSGTSGSGFSGYLDNFGRVTRSQWKKLLGSPVTLYDVTLTYDRNGNITSADDAVTGSGAGWDAKYAMDNLNRLLDADEGTLTAGSIGSRTRRERWDENSAGYGLDQVGNWKRRKLDLDGDGSYSGGGELNDTGAFNAANEWLTRDTDSNSSVNYTLTHDAVGNLTDDGQNYKYVYDVFGRLVKVKNQSNNTVAEYAYDGLGQRISTHTDVGGNGSVTTADHTYWFIYDDRWRIIATYRCEWDGGSSTYLPDTEHKEQFVWHNVGMDGRGGSSYIDSVILRDRDNSSGWLAASDGDHEERRLFGPNWRADVSLVMNTNGRPLERVKYTAYGTPITLTDIDYNDDKSIDPDDLGDFVNTPYDWDLDGDTNSPADSDNDAFSDDYFAVAGNSYGRGVLSLAGIGSRIGYAGYIYDRFISGSDGGRWFVRHRVLNSGLGRWTRRDPLGYVDGMGLYEYVQSVPTRYMDASGLGIYEPNDIDPKDPCAAQRQRLRELLDRQRTVPPFVDIPVPPFYMPNPLWIPLAFEILEAYRDLMRCLLRQPITPSPPGPPANPGVPGRSPGRRIQPPRDWEPGPRRAPLPGGVPPPPCTSPSLPDQPCAWADNLFTSLTPCDWAKDCGCGMQLGYNRQICGRCNDGTPADKALCEEGAAGTYTVCMATCRWYDWWDRNPDGTYPPSDQPPPAVPPGPRIPSGS